MFNQATALGKTLITLVTLEGFFSSVNPDMSNQIRFVGKTFTTVGTLVVFVITSSVVHC